MQKTILFTALSAALLSGCASITTGTNQSVTVDTGHTTGATCKLSNDKGTWYVNSTPGSVTVERSSSDLSVTCTASGGKSGVSVVKSTTKGMAFGNLVCGGLIGAAVDCSSGAAYDYPTTIQVAMK